MIGYIIGRIKIKGIEVGDAGILIVSLIAGHFGVTCPSFAKSIGIVLFVASVGLIAGPKFFHNFTVNLELDNVIPTRRLRNYPSYPILRKQTLRSRSTRQIPPRPLHRQSQFRGPDIPPPLFCKVLISK